MVYMYRQGDLLFIKINEIPKKRKRRYKYDVLAWGETTGHTHKLENGAIYRAINEQGQYRTYIEAKNNTKVVQIPALVQSI